ncbi:hypothetical protein [Streptomyces sp. CBMA156]|uniref:hypothetical protein n=1 Tax=Streptomyces sp. CBMA156 TaxID=1930280 RepID=UPI001661D807|nr:hypothetical protein [Streptomyces sp. CBMA156]MBD0675259.1 hypothetical protein [Streptomyces sp. CBMA156]
MGVLTDYFRAADAATVVRALELTEGGLPPLGGEGSFDGVEAKGVDPDVVLGQLVAVVLGEPWRTGLVTETAVWPATPAPGPSGPADEDDPWATGPWVTELGAAARDALAAIPDERVPEAVGRWAEAEEWDGADPSDLLPLAEELIALARRARAAGERLYCWICL